MRPEWIPTKEQEEAGITQSDLMREYAPVRTPSLKESWPVDGWGDPIPLKDMTVSDMAVFPDEHREELIKLCRKENLPAPAKLLEEMAPSEIATDTALANLRLGEILNEMGLLKVGYR
jgi:hypothetical protein